MKNPGSHLSEVSSTMLITLYARAYETLSRDPVITDPKAVEMIEIIKKEIAGSDNPIHKKILKNKYHSKLAVTMSLRSRRFDRYVTDFLTKYPEGTIINLGCGLDTRFYRIDNGNVIWYDLDFPEVIELRKRFMEENSRHFFIGNSVLSQEWFAKVKTGGPYLVLAEGLFMYLNEANVRELFHRILQELGSAEIVCEVTNDYWVKRMNKSWMKWKFKRQLGMTGGAVFSFGIPYSRYFEKWSPEYKFLDEWTYFDDQEKKLGWFNLFSSIDVLRKAQWTVHYRIGK
ncbi:MAG: class I SAM-dependent methyltransferase [Bacteroidales bacterium]|nr:class I SAM-dependent methyltransferase [Bacteroidales bacterium]